MATNPEKWMVLTIMHERGADGTLIQVDSIKEEVAADHKLLEQSFSPTFIEREGPVEPGTPEYTVISVKCDANGGGGSSMTRALTTVPEYKIVSQALLSKHHEEQLGDTPDVVLPQQGGELVLAQQGGDLVVARLGHEVADLGQVIDKPRVAFEQHPGDGVDGVVGVAARFCQPLSLHGKPKAIEWLDYPEAKPAVDVGDGTKAGHAEFTTSYSTTRAQVTTSSHLSGKGKWWKIISALLFSVLLIASLLVGFVLMAVRLPEDGLERTYETHRDFAKMLNTTRLLGGVADSLSAKTIRTHSIGLEIGASQLPGKDELAALVITTATSMNDVPLNLHAFTHSVRLMAVRLQEEHASTLRDLEKRAKRSILSWDSVKYGMPPSTNELRRQWVRITLTLRGILRALAMEADDLIVMLNDIETSLGKVEGEMIASRATQVANQRELNSGWLGAFFSSQASAYDTDIGLLSSFVQDIQAARKYVDSIKFDVARANRAIAALDSSSWVDESVGFVKWFSGHQLDAHESLTKLVSVLHSELRTSLDPESPQSQ